MIETAWSAKANRQPPNQRLNALVRPVTPLAVASVAPVRPARYRVRWADS